MLTVNKSVCLRCNLSFAIDWLERQEDKTNHTKTLTSKWWCYSEAEECESLISHGGDLPDQCIMKLEMLLAQ